MEIPTVTSIVNSRLGREDNKFQDRAVFKKLLIAGNKVRLY